MRRIELLVALAASLACVVALPAGGSTQPRHTVLHYGDSLTVGTGPYLGTFLRGWSITESAEVSRHADEGARTLQSLRASLPHVVVISLGTNDDPGAVSAFAADVREVATAAGRNRCVIWSTVVRPAYNGVSYAAYNRVLRHAAARYPGFRVFDWHGLALAHPGWFGPDGVHPSAAGYRARAAAIAALVKKTC